MKTPLRLAGIVVAVAICLLNGCARGRGPASEATGRLESTVVDIPALGGKGVSISHDGLTVTTPDGRTQKLDPGRTPFKVIDGSALAGLVAGDRVTFKYRQLRTDKFPFELVTATKAAPR